MTIIIDENVIGLWYISLNENLDYLGCLTGGEKIQIKYRFRYYDNKDHNPFSEKDEKNWYNGTFANNDKEAAIKKMREVVKAICDIGKHKYTELLMENGDVDKFLVMLISF